MKATRFGLSLCFAFYSFVLFFVTAVVQEVAFDQLEGMPSPLPLKVSRVFDPVSFMVFIFPALVGFACWRCLPPVKPSFQLVLTHFLLIGFSVTAFASTLTAAIFFAYLNEYHPVSGIQICGNVLMALGLVFVIVRSYLPPKRTEQAGDGKPDSVVS